MVSSRLGGGFVLLLFVCVLVMLPSIAVLAGEHALVSGDDAIGAAVGVAVMSGVFGSLGTYAGYAVTGVGAASLLLQGISLITGITPSTRDDEYVNEAYRAVVKVQRWLDRLAFNPSADKARRR